MQPTHIPAGDYLTVSQVAERFGVIRRTVHQWLEKNWVPAIELPGLGVIINVRDLEGFTPPKPGRKPAEGRE